MQAEASLNNNKKKSQEKSKKINEQRRLQILTLISKFYSLKFKSIIVLRS